jgi:hypothetical protein
MIKVDGSQLVNSSNWPNSPRIHNIHTRLVDVYEIQIEAIATFQALVFKAPTHILFITKVNILCSLSSHINHPTLC